MPTPITKTLAYNGDYTTWAGAATAINAMNLVALDQTLTLVVGQSAAGNPVWTNGATTTFSPTTDATHTLTIAGNVPWNPAAALNWNRTGATTQPILLTGSVGSYGSLLALASPYITVQDLQVVNTNLSGRGVYGSYTLTINRCWLQADTTDAIGQFLGPLAADHNAGAVLTVIDSVLYASLTASPQCLMFTANDTRFYGVTFVGGYDAVYLTATSHVFTNCAFYNQSNGFLWSASTAGATFVGCATDQSVVFSGLTQIGTAAGNFTSVVDATLDLRPKSNASINLNINSAPPTAPELTDIYGVTRGSYPTFGAVEGPTAATVQPVSWEFGYNKDLTSMAAFIGSGSWDSGTGLFTVAPVALTTSAATASGNVLTLASPAPSTIQIGMAVTDTTTPGAIPGGTVIIAINDGGNNIKLSNNVTGGGVGSGDNISVGFVGSAKIGDILYFNNGSADPVLMQVTSFSGSGSGGNGTYPVTLWNTYYTPTNGFVSPVRVDMATQTAGSNVGYLLYNQVCTGTASSSTTIKIAASVACVGHPIQWKSGNICIIGSYDPISQVATVATPPAGSSYSASFGGTPQSGDAFTIFPSNVRFVIGESAAGNRLWSLTSTGLSLKYVGGISLSSVLRGTVSTITLQGKWAFDPAVALGTIVGAGSTSAAAISMGGNYASVVQVRTTGGTVVMNDLQLFSRPDTTEEAGCILTDEVTFSGGGCYTFNRGVKYGQTTALDHPAGTFFGGPNSTEVNVLTIAGSYAFPSLDNGIVKVNCMNACTYNAVATVAGAGAASGQPTIPLVSVTGLVVGMYLAAQSGTTTAGLKIQSINSGASPPTVTMNGNITASLAAGDKCYFGAQVPMYAQVWVSGMTDSIQAGCAFINNTNNTNCMVDLNGTAMTQFNYATAYPGLFGVQNSGIDGRPAGAFSPTLTAIDPRTGGVDIFGRARVVGASAIGPIETAAASGTSRNMMMLGVG